MASLEIVALDTATPQLEVPQSGDTYSAPRALAISPQSLTGASATTSLDIAQTWNTTGTPTAVKLNVTDTASNANSLLMDLGTGGGTFVSQFKVSKTGIVTVGNPAGGFVNSVGIATPGINVGNGASIVSAITGAQVNIWDSNVNTTSLNTGGVVVRASASVAWGSGTSVGSPDIFLARDAANTLAQRNATNAQTFRVYNTYTSLTNRENIRIAAASNVFYIEPEKGSGGGTLRPLVVGHGATTYAALPAASAALEGARAYVSDWTGAATFGTTVNAGGGTTKVPVWCDGTNWLVG